MVKNTKDINLISFVLKLEVEKWKNFDLKEDNLARVLFCEKKLNINFKKIGFEFEKQPDMEFNVKCDKQTENIQKIGTYYFDITTNYQKDYNEFFIQLYFKMSGKIDNLTQELEDSLKEIITKNLENKYLLFSYDDQSRPSGPIEIKSVSF